MDPLSDLLLPQGGGFTPADPIYSADPQPRAYRPSGAGTTQWAPNTRLAGTARLKLRVDAPGWTAAQKAAALAGVRGFSTSNAFAAARDAAAQLVAGGSSVAQFSVTFEDQQLVGSDRTQTAVVNFDVTLRSATTIQQFAAILGRGIAWGFQASAEPWLGDRGNFSALARDAIAAGTGRTATSGPTVQGVILLGSASSVPPVGAPPTQPTQPQPPTQPTQPQPPMRPTQPAAATCRATPVEGFYLRSTATVSREGAPHFNARTPVDLLPWPSGVTRLSSGASKLYKVRVVSTGQEGFALFTPADVASAGSCASAAAVAPSTTTSGTSTPTTRHDSTGGRGLATPPPGTVVMGGGSGASSSSNTMFYVGAGVVILGLGVAVNWQTVKKLWKR